MSIAIRAARKGDATDLYETWQGLRHHNASIDSRIINAPVSHEDFVEAMDSILGRSHSATFVAEDDGRVVGFVRGVIETQQPDRLPEQHATIGYLFVAPEYRRLGLGRQLFSAVADWASVQAGISHFEMTVLASDEQATGFWVNLGFSPFIQRLWAPLPATDPRRVIIYLVRHGETAYNRDGLGLGIADVPLTEHGLRQASAVGDRFAGIELTRVLSSPLGRAASVAAAIAGERVAIERRAELIEMDVGATEGLTFVEMRARFPDFLKQWASDDSTHVRMPGGESIADVAQRMGVLLNEVRDWDEPAIALVSHNFVLKVGICLLLNLPPSGFRSIGIDLASVTTVAIHRGRVTVQSLNDTCHLQHLNVPAGTGTVTS